LNLLLVPCFTEIYSLFYVNNVKLIPGNIYELLTPVALAHMIMGDGLYKNGGLTLCTDCYSVKDVVKLLNVLVIRYGLICSMQQHNKGQYRIYIQKKSLKLLDSIERPPAGGSWYVI